MRRETFLAVAFGLFCALTAAHAQPPASFTREPGVAFIAGSPNLRYYQGTSAQACEADCAADGRCAAYTFVRAGGYRAGEPPMCYLQAGLGPKSSHTCCFTGIKTGGRGGPTTVPSLANGRTFACETKANGQTWPCQVRFTSYNPASGRIEGELTWTTLNSIHAVEGTLVQGRLVFQETRAIRAGSAYLNGRYDLAVSGDGASGSYLDPSSGLRGTMTIGGAGAAPPPPPAAPPPQQPATALATGRTFACETKANGQTWPCQVRFTSYNPASGLIEGELTWTTLNSIHAVEGTLVQGRLVFQETRAIRAGSAYLNGRYDLAVSGESASGSYLDPSSGLRGTMTIGAASAAAPPPPAAPPQQPVTALAGGRTLPCETKANGQTWPCQVRFTSYNPASGRIEGELTWTTLNSIHAVEGTLVQGRLVFQETRAIRAGSAYLNGRYDLAVSGESASGSYLDPSSGLRGTMTIGFVGAAPAAAQPSRSPLTSGGTFTCEAQSAAGQKWPCQIRSTGYDPDTGRITGELTWTSAASVHFVEGTLRGDRLIFTEVRAIRPGAATLGSSYDLRIGSSAVTGSYYDPVSRTNGTMTIFLSR
jgi:hypothetical protein